MTEPLRELSGASTRLTGASLGNLANQTSMEFLVNQEILEESLEVDFEELAPYGLSHKRLQYKGTGNLKIPVQVYMSDAIHQRLAGSMAAPLIQYATILERKAWLQALCYPSSNADYSRVGPPMVLFTWPGVVRIVARVVSWKTTHRLFSMRDFHTTALVTTLDLVEHLDTRKLMEDVIIEGSIHVAEAEV